MSDTPPYSYTDNDVQSAFDEINRTLFNNKTSAAVPKMLVVTGIQGSGKTYLLENTLLSAGKYANCIRLYLPDYRKKHPQYAQMESKGVLHAYEHTEAFVKEVCTKIFTKALSGKYSIIMESALDSVEFASFPPMAVTAGYQFEVHVVACKKEFTHLSTITRGLKSLKDKQLERFLRAADLNASLANAQSILTAFEEACTKVVGSQITLYERGFGALKDRRVVCHSLCDNVANLTPQPIKNSDGNVIKPEDNLVRIERSALKTTPSAYSAYANIVNVDVVRHERREMVWDCQLALADTVGFREEVPVFVFTDLFAYILKYTYR
ncbi:zeta toxin family protein [Pseudomonas sp. H11T01]|uniref:zeta toxin family protein n=1 Tax=Pseudomonas sp. H11T01 TaxID=3402749 RepID=UPI003ABE1FF9